jgi:hypothetical protein
LLRGRARALLQRAWENELRGKKFAARAFAPSCAANLPLRLPRATLTNRHRNFPPARRSLCHSPRAAVALLAPLPLPLASRRRRPPPVTRCLRAAALAPATAASGRGPTGRSTRRSAPARSASVSAPSRPAQS